MLIEAIIVSGAVALCSLVGALFFGNSRHLEGLERYIIPAAVGVFLSLTLFELIPETLHNNEIWGGVMVATGFILFYILSYVLHRYFHDHGNHDDKDCDRRGAANLLLIGDAIHNLADGVILGSAFLVDPAVGVAVAIGLALHEIPQEIVEFGVLVRGGYNLIEASWRNLISASSIVVGTVLTIILATTAEQYVWIITGLAAGNLLYIAASDLLPRVHGSLESYKNFWYTVVTLVVGFTVMTGVLVYTHEQFGHSHNESEVHTEDEDHGHEEEDDHHEEELRN